jgi:hypothetical protein
MVTEMAVMEWDNEGDGGDGGGGGDVAVVVCSELHHRAFYFDAVTGKVAIPVDEYRREIIQQ